VGSGVCGAVRGTAGYSIAVGRSNALFYHYKSTAWKHRALRVACSECVHCANAFRMDSSNTSFTTKSCPRTSIALLVGIISWPVDTRRHRFGGTCCLHVRVRYTLKTEATVYSKMLVPICRNAWRHIPEDQGRDIHCRKNLISYKW
jgi:hypothetical protein